MYVGSEDDFCERFAFESNFSRGIIACLVKEASRAMDSSLVGKRQQRLDLRYSSISCLNMKPSKMIFSRDEEM